MALTNIPISPDECIGDSLTTINNAFVELDARTINLTGGATSDVFAGVSAASSYSLDSSIFLRIAVGPYYKYLPLYDINGVYNESIGAPSPTLVPVWSDSTGSWSDTQVWIDTLAEII